MYITQASHSEIDRLGTLQKKKGCVKDNSDLTCITNLILRSELNCKCSIKDG